MLSRYLDTSGALLAGAILAAMIQVNSALGHVTSAVTAAWVAHGVGLLCSLALLAVSPEPRKLNTSAPPSWAYLGGITGALTVWLASITVNSSLGLSRSLLLMVSGQILFGIAADRFGLLGLQKRHLRWTDASVVLLILIGCLLIVGGGA